MATSVISDDGDLIYRFAALGSRSPAQAGRRGPPGSPRPNRSPQELDLEAFDRELGQGGEATSFDFDEVEEPAGPSQAQHAAAHRPYKKDET